MLLDLQDNELVLSSNAPMAAYQKRQFVYYGGIQSDEAFHFADASAELVNRILAFCEAEELKTELTPSVEALVERHQSEQSYHQGFIASAGSFKNGQYDKSDYADHVKFLDKHIQRKLLDHQIKASYHLSLIGNGANFSVPGSGKTTVLLSYYEKLKVTNKVDVLFVVGPPACFGPWREEFETVLGRSPNECLLAGGSQSERKRRYSYPPENAELFLTTFQTLQNDFDLVKKMLGKDNLRALLVVDEAHYIKQVDGRWANAVLAIAPVAKYRCVLTGTPVPHSYKDLFNLFAFLWQEHSPLSDEDHARLEIYEKNSDYERASSLLAPKLDPLFYRVRKKDLGLMPQHMNVVPLKMRPVEKSVYDVVIGNVRQLTTRDYLRQMDAISMLRKGRVMRLRQAVSYPKLLTSAIEDYNEDVLAGDKNVLNTIIKYTELEVPAKLEKLIELVTKYTSENKKVVVWSNFLLTIELIVALLNERGIRTKKIVGQTPIEREGIEIADTREKIREEFVEPSSGLNVLVANPAACAESISLHKTCHNAIYYDLSFNCAQFLQSLDRIHRVGGSEKVPSYYDFLIYEDTVDTKIYNNLLTKADRMKALIDQDYSIYSLDMSENNDDIKLEELLGE